MSDIIFEKIYVETCVDSDKDGKLDLIAVYVRRPKNQMNVPAIFVANPYMMSCNEDWYDVYDVDKPIEIIENQNISEQDIRFDFSAKNDLGDITPRVTRGYADVSPCNEDFELECISELYSHLEKRGYASVFSAGLGTLGSQGVVNTGSYDEVLAFKSVIDWLCGRTRAFTNQIDNIEVRADWCSKKVAMSAKSYLGTLAIGVATTGVEGLETIIPEAGISNWYEYYRYNGLTLPAYEWQGDDLDLLAKYCSSRAKDEQDFASIKQIFDKNDAFLAKNIDRVSGNYNKFWDERNYLNNAEKIKASVFIIHGINDWNVKTSHCYNLFKELEKYDIDRKIMLHQGEHIYIYNLKNSDTLQTIERWLDFYLKGIDTGIKDEPKVLVQSNVDQLLWHKNDNLTVSDKNIVNFPIDSCKSEIKIIDDLKNSAYIKSISEWRDELVLDESSSNKIAFYGNLSELINCKAVRLSGSVTVAFSAKINQKTAVLSAMLVDLEEDDRLSNELNNLDDGSFIFKEISAKYKIISRGWLNAQNRVCNFIKENIKIDEFYNYTFDMIPTDYTIKENHKVALIIYGIDADFTQRSEIVTEIIVKTDTIKVKLPIYGI